MTLKEWMTDTGETDATLAAKARVSRPFVTKIRLGTRQPSLPVALRLAEVTKLPVETFIKAAA